MPDADPERRVEILEEKMDQLGDVPARLVAIESQIVQLRSEMRGGFSAVRRETDALGERLRTEMRQGDRGLQTEIGEVDRSLRAEMRQLGEDLRAEMRALNVQTRVEMRVLHEEVISRLALLQEHGARRRKKKP